VEQVTTRPLEDFRGIRSVAVILITRQHVCQLRLIHLPHHFFDLFGTHRTVHEYARLQDQPTVSMRSLLLNDISPPSDG